MRGASSSIETNQNDRPVGRPFDYPPVGPGGRIVTYFQRWPAAMTRLELASADRNMTTRKTCERSMGFM